MAMPSSTFEVCLAAERFAAILRQRRRVLAGPETRGSVAAGLAAVWRAHHEQTWPEAKDRRIAGARGMAKTAASIGRRFPR